MLNYEEKGSLVFCDFDLYKELSQLLDLVARVEIFFL